MNKGVNSVCLVGNAMCMQLSCKHSHNWVVFVLSDIGSAAWR